MPMQSKAMTIAGWALTALIGAGLTFSAIMKFLSPEEMIDQFVNKLGYPAGLAVKIGVVEVVCTLLFVFPRTAVLGAVLLGGAIATHVRIEDNFAGAAIGGVLVWLSLYLREPSVRAILPFFSTSTSSNVVASGAGSWTTMRKVEATITEVQARNER